MGGNALKKYETRRYSKSEYLLLENRIRTDFVHLFGREPIFIPYYHNKVDFGDMDILFPSTQIPNNWKEKLINYYRLTDDMHVNVSNSGVFSFAVDRFQVDLIFSGTEKDSEMAKNYFAFNDLGNLIGRIYHKLGVKYGHRGLHLIIRLDESQHVLDEILLSQDMKEILSIIGLSYDEYLEGFDDLEDIFRFVAKSKFFDPDIYLLHNRNHKAVIRDKKRATYNGFLEWIRREKPPVQFSFEEKTERGGYNIREPFYSEIIVPMFPWIEDRVSKMITRYQLTQEVRKYYNGCIIGAVTGLSGKELGFFIQKNDLNPTHWSEDKIRFQVKFIKEIINRAEVLEEY
jgi:hypothetical protein